MPAAQLGEIVAEHNIQDPVQPVLDPPVATHRPGERLGIEPGREKA